MKIRDLRLVGIRCFEDTGTISFDKKCNVFIGKNNAGKSSLTKAIIGLQMSPFDDADVRHGNPPSSFATISFHDIMANEHTNLARAAGQNPFRVSCLYKGDFPSYDDMELFNVNSGQIIFSSTRPAHSIVPFLAKRKSAVFSHDITLGMQSRVDGTLSSLYSRIDLLATTGHPLNDQFVAMINLVVGLPITTKASSGGKEAGFYFGEGRFITLDRMGDGVYEMVALIVELCTEKNKIFVLEEPETNLHPRGLKSLLALIRAASEYNQFFIATHSNVVVRELGGIDVGRVFRVFRDGEHYTNPSKVEEVERTPAAHTELLKELGYEFADFDLHDAWLFLEESSCERVIRDILIPNFAPKLRGRLRTFSAGGVTNLEPSVSEFQRLVVFIHLQPVYEGRLWIRADGDEAGVEAVQKLRVAFPYLDENALCTFSKEHFELYYPDFFQEKVKMVLAINDKQERRKRKIELLQEVLDWSDTEKEGAIAAWAKSADEQIKLLQSIETKLAAV